MYDYLLDIHRHIENIEMVISLNLQIYDCDFSKCDNVVIVMILKTTWLNTIVKIVIIGAALFR